MTGRPSTFANFYPCHYSHFRMSTILVVSQILISALGYLQAGEPREPTSSERKVFESELKQLLEHKDLLPYAVDEVIKSLTDTVEINFECGEGFRVNAVSIKMTTRLIKWDPNLTVSGQAIQAPENSAGFYVWRPLIRIQAKQKAIVATNMIFLDTEGMGKHKVPLPFEEASILYHELLHGQLMIDAMMEKDWRRQSCVCHFDTEPQDGEHLRIPHLIHIYFAKLAEQHPDVYGLEIPAQPEAESDGRFKIALASLESVEENLKWDTVCFYPERSNIEPRSFSVVVEENELVATGRLADKADKGFMLVYLSTAPGKASINLLKAGALDRRSESNKPPKRKP